MERREHDVFESDSGKRRVRLGCDMMVISGI